ncbi:MAG: ATP-binding protein [Lachnospiraceae bacterium]|nr:ATP-binding protein [Lachnospiraceae bacterium]
MTKLDKYEYNLKLEEIDKLVDQGDYEEAANLADTIEWRRVRNVRTLCLISEIYEAAGKLDKSKDMLVRAYRKSPVGRNVLYRLVEVTTALGEYDEALEYFAEYVQTAPHDNNRYILKYKIYRGRGSSTEELISILEEYLGQEYTERWAYELAVLYQEAGQIQKCMATCDDLVLWFHTGKYVKKALEMKKRYAVLTPKQQQIYEICQQEEAQNDYFDDTEDDATIVRSTEEADGEVLAENIMAETEKEIAGEITARKAEKEKNHQPEPSSKSGEPNLLAKVFRKGAELKRPSKNAKKEAGAVAEPAADGKTEADSGAAEPKVDGIARAERATAISAGRGLPSPENGSGWSHVSDESVADENSISAAMPGLEQVFPADEEEASEYGDLQVELAKSVRKVILGVARRPELNEDDVPAAVEERLRDIQEIRERREPEPKPGRLSIDDILLSMGEKGKQAAAAARAQREAEAAAQAEAAAAESEEAEMVSLAGTAAESGKSDAVHPAEIADGAEVGAGDIVHVAEPADGVELPPPAGRRQDVPSIGRNASRLDSTAEAGVRDTAQPAEPADGVELPPPAGRRQDVPSIGRNASRLDSTAEAGVRDTAQPAEPADGVELPPPAGRRQDVPSIGRNASCLDSTAEVGAGDAAQSVESAYGAEAGETEAARPMRAAASAEARQAGALREMRASGEAGGQAASAASAEGNVARLIGDSEDFVSAAPVRTVTAAAAEELPREQLEALQYSSNPEKLLRNRNALPTYSSETGFEKTRKINTKEELMEAARRELMETKTIRIPAEEIAKAYSYQTTDLSEAAAGAGLEAASSEGPGQNGEKGKMDEKSRNGNDAERQEVCEDRGKQADAFEAEPVQELREKPEEDEPEPEEYFDDPLTIEPHLRGLFPGFTEIEGLEDQIANAILQAMAKGADRTSRNGNILIFGAHGAGKTTLAIGLAKAIAQEKGRQTAKMAKIYAVDLNRRDIAATIAKIAGGTLIIEEAGDLADNTVEQLTTAMEFRTDGLIVILEDEQRYIHDLLMKHPRFTMKFTAQIYLPVYTADELVMFALRHAHELDYSISEDGIEAIRQKVAEKSSTETPMSVGDIVELVDRAIRNSNKFMRKMSMGKKRYDENDFVLLFAKDFK